MRVDLQEGRKGHEGKFMNMGLIFVQSISFYELVQGYCQGLLFSLPLLSPLQHLFKWNKEPEMGNRNVTIWDP